MRAKTKQKQSVENKKVKGYFKINLYEDDYWDAECDNIITSTLITFLEIEKTRMVNKCLSKCEVNK